MEQNQPTDSQWALLFSIGIGGVVAVVTIGTFWWIYYLAIVQDPILYQQAQAAAAPYSPSDGILAITNAEPNIPPEGDNRQPWLGFENWQAGIQAGQEYIRNFPEPQNVQILTGMRTSEIWTYMQQHISGALGVGCQYCHDINNFAADPYPQKASARLMLLLVNDLNAKFITNLPNWRGYYVQCATCHTNAAVDLPSVSSAFDVSTPPIELTLEPLDMEGMPVRDAQARYSQHEATLYYVYNYLVWQPFEFVPPEVNPNLKTGRGSLSQVSPVGRTQEQTTITQNTMNLMSWSLGQGCNFCHNARNFYAFESGNVGSQFVELNGLNRLKAQQMLLMTTYMGQHWDRYVLPRPALQDMEQRLFVEFPFTAPPNTERAKPVQRLAYQYPYTYLQVFDPEREGTDSPRRSNFSVPGCYTCHRGNNIPKTAIHEEGMPMMEGNIETMTFKADQNTTFPSVIRGQNGR